MSHGKVRDEKSCLNCGHVVEERFCPHCGQENIQPKQPFYYLFTHFIEDFTHYDGQFWKTIKYLLVRPGKLTKEYLAGKRQSYVAPVKLYIFISFITFFLPSLLSSSEEEQEKNNVYTLNTTEREKASKERVAKILDSINKENKNMLIPKSAINDLKVTEVNGNDIETDALGETKDGKLMILGAKNMKQFDSLYAKRADDRSSFDFMRPIAKKIFHLQEQGLNKQQIFAKFTDTVVHTLPKALFIYLPIFAFFLWLFHNKKKWWFFDNGIFTLHYFSFLLLGILILIFLSDLMSLLPDYSIFNILNSLVYTAAIAYMLVYFFIAHHRVYENSRSISVIKGISLFIINSLALLCMLLLLIYISFRMMH
ncbi:rubrerythrin [Chryseobacterium sp. SLBN-27]|uniref:DUF3667 domain-containing protein n=1 Tax=Chryseobacterium sp. SLBN-27 TaxID=3042287 RepID=UPI002862FE23|nr:DUF3667 domain-containing protein [Chryseobacterium sp. SLBN-27]MDR6159771.1 rubrerythrin [Chryseobacterium sp. SLBN-27]